MRRKVVLNLSIALASEAFITLRMVVFQFGHLVLLLFALAVICHVFGPVVLPDSASSVYFGKCCIGFYPLVLPWLLPVAGLALSFHPIARHLWPLVQLGCQWTALNATLPHLISLNSRRSLNWHLLQNRNTVQGFNWIVPCLRLVIVDCKISSGWRLFGS